MIRDGVVADQEALARLGHVSQARPTQIVNLLQLAPDMRDLASPIAAFVRDCCVVAPNQSVIIGDLYSAWQKWCEEQGRGKFVSTVQVFGRDLVAAFPSIRRSQPRQGDGRIRVYLGIGLKEGY